MVSLIGEWVGKDVKITLQGNVILPLQGKLLQADGAGLLLEQPKGHCFVPVTSILHVVLQDQNA